MSQVKILLAEDDKRLGTILKAYLDAKGYTTTLCVDGEEAIEAFNAELFDLCITDVVMPGMDGFTLAKQIKALKPYMPLIFLTAKKEQSDILEGFRLGADDYITLIRNANLLSFDVAAIRAADAPGVHNASPNGFNGEEACRMTRYAGLSYKLSSIGFFEYNPHYDINARTANLIAEMILPSSGSTSQ